MPQWRQDAFVDRGEIDFAIEMDTVGRFPRQRLPSAGRPRARDPLRGAEVPGIAELGLPAIVTRLADEHDGLVLVTGSTGSGKSTTLASIIAHINVTRDAHIVTIEDPVEYRHVEQRCLISQREIGQDTESFRSALKMVLRQGPRRDPDRRDARRRDRVGRRDRGRDRSPRVRHAAHRDQRPRP